MTGHARNERRQLASLLLELGPDAPTLNEGWTTRDLAAHIVVRDRRPDSMAAQLVPPLRAHGEHVRLAKAAEPYATIVHEVRTPPWWSLLSNPLVDELANTGEFFIHHEDCRRAVDGWEPRNLDPGLEKALWRATQLSGKIALRRLGLPVTVRATGLGSFSAGDDPQAVVEGRAGELALFLSGRQRAARVTLDGPAEVTERLRTARLGF